jgi:phospholipid-transporting ATPase
MFIELYYATVNAFSGQVLYEKWMIAAFNVMFTLLPPLAIGIFDQHLSKETLLAVPQLYRTGQKGLLFNTKTFWTWAGNAWFHCTLAYYLVFQAFKSNIAKADGHVQGQWYVGSIVYAVVVYTVTFKAAMVSNNWTAWVHASIWGSLGIWTLFTVIYFNMWKGGLFGSMAAEVYGVSGMMYSTPAYWALIFLVPIISLWRDFVWESFRQNFLPGPNDIMRKAELLRGSSFAELLAPMQRVPDTASHTNEHLGFAFSGADNADTTNTVSQVDLIRRYNTESVVKPDGE